MGSSVKNLTQLSSANTMRHFFPSLICIVSMLFVFDISSADDELVPHSSSRIFGFCCGTVKNKCATGCAGKNCDITCSGTCGIFNTACSYTCGQVTNACNAATTTITTTTTTTTTTSTTTTTPTTTTTTATACI